MTRLPEQLPDDSAALKELVSQLWRQVEHLQQQVRWLTRRQFGASAERYDAHQKVFEFAQGEESAEMLPAAPSVSRDAPVSTPLPRGRRPLPRELPRRRIEYKPAPEDLVCAVCGGPKRKIGEEVSEQIEFVPASLFVVQHARLKYACPRCQESVVVAPLPDKLIEKGLPGAGILTEVLVSKYGDHLPLHRQEGIFERHGLRIPRSTQCQWVAAGADLLKPLYACMKGEVLRSKKIHTDDTPAKVQEPGRGRTKTGRFWVYVGDEEHAHVVFAYTANRKRDGPAEFLRGYKGYLQADAYGGYDGLYAGEEIIEVACWAHARRKFFEARETDPRADEALDVIGALYGVERAGKELSAHGRQELRRLQAAPILARLKSWLESRSWDTLPKSPLGQAVQYALGQWKALNRYLEDGVLDIDNNQAENALRPIAVGRKNWLFCGNDRGGERAAIIYSLLASCKRNGVEPWTYLYDVLPRLSTHPARKVLELTPAHWQPLNPPPQTHAI